MADYGIRVAKAGYDALTGPDNQMAFTSKYVSEKVLQTVVIVVTIPAGTNTSGSTAYTHNLGFTPKVLAFDYTSGSVIIPHLIGDAFGSVGIHGTADILITPTQITITAAIRAGSTFASPRDVTFVVFIMDSSI